MRAVLIALLLICSVPAIAGSRRCTGARNCVACTTCGYCAYCSVPGHGCGVCRRDKASTKRHPSDWRRKAKKRVPAHR